MDKHKPNYILKSLRAGQGVYQSDMAKLLGITNATYSKKESGKSDFTLSECRKLSAYFNMNPTDIFFTD